MRKIILALLLMPTLTLASMTGRTCKIYYQSNYEMSKEDHRFSRLFFGSPLVPTYLGKYDVIRLSKDKYFLKADLEGNDKVSYRGELSFLKNVEVIGKYVFTYDKKYSAQEKTPIYSEEREHFYIEYRLSKREIWITENTNHNRLVFTLGDCKKKEFEDADKKEFVSNKHGAIDEKNIDGKASVAPSEYHDKSAVHTVTAS